MEINTVINRLKSLVLQIFPHPALEDLSNLSSDSKQAVDELIRFLVRHREPLIHWLGAGDSDENTKSRDDLLRFFVSRTQKLIYIRNQFILLKKGDQKNLKTLYEEFLGGLYDTLREAPDQNQLPRDLEVVLGNHQAHLLGFFKSLSDSNPGLRRDFLLQALPCHEYSPQKQLQILGAEADSLLEPILDMGCGARGVLVQYLRDMGKKAFGIDRVVEKGNFLLEADWLDHPLKAEYWGTVIAHLGFSNHFLHHHLRKDGEPDRYARKYMEILHALKPGGSFLYAPGLPFIENLLPNDEYDVLRLPIPELTASPVDDLIRKAHGTSILYTCRVLKKSREG
jgi:hypothetical protein